MHAQSLTNVSDLTESYFNYELNYDDHTIVVDTLYSSTPVEVASTQVLTRAGSASRETYSAIGSLLYRVTVSATLSYTSNSCSNTSKSGSFERGPLSFFSC